MIGEIVTVTVDRPIGSRHPDYPDMVYPINYGYVKGIIAPDGEEQDAYVLGVDEPISEFCGRVVAIICREDDVEDKLVVASTSASVTESEIISKTHFQEKYFKIKVKMLK
jgi:inorganic pyrophosphatase